jgi:hypothetical protein
MTKINFGRLFIGGLIASVLLFFSDGALHEYVFHDYWEYVYHGIGGREPEQAGHGMAIAYFFIFELGRGFLVFSAIVAWLAFSVTAPAEFIPLGFYSRRLWIMVAGAQLVTSIVANLIAAWMYTDPVTTVSEAT